MRHHRHPANVAIHDRKNHIDKAVDRFVTQFGSLRYIAWQTVFIIVWLALNAVAWALRWDPYPWILLNLIFSTQAAYAAPLILMAQNRSAEHDRLRAEDDYHVNQQALEKLQLLHAEHAGLRASIEALVRQQGTSR